MSDNDNGRRFHITFNAYERQILERMRDMHGTSLSGAIRVCIRAAAAQLEKNPQTQE